MISYYHKPIYMNFFDLKTLFCLSKQYALYENKHQESEKQGIGSLKHIGE